MKAFLNKIQMSVYLASSMLLTLNVKANEHQMRNAIYCAKVRAQHDLALHGALMRVGTASERVPVQVVRLDYAISNKEVFIHDAVVKYRGGA